MEKMTPTWISEPQDGVSCSAFLHDYEVVKIWRLGGGGGGGANEERRQKREPTNNVA